MTYTGIGYWREPIFRWVPEERRVRREGWSETWRADPVKLMESLGSCAPDPRVVSYLRQGHVFAAWRGYSFCRFQCGLPDEAMGHRCLTDGIWVWPEGLVHYVERHQLPLPQQFIDHARQGNRHEAVVIDRATDSVDTTFWNDWYDAQRSAA